MSKDLLDIARGVITTAKKHGAQHARASAQRSRTSEVEWRDGKLDRLRESVRMGISVTLYVDGRYSSHSTSDLRPGALDSFVSGAVAMTRVLSQDPHRHLPDPRRYEGRHTGDLGLYDPRGIAGLRAEERQRLAAALEAAARSVPAAERKRIISVTGSWSDTEKESALVASNGMEGTRRGTVFEMGAVTSVRDEGDRKPRGYWYAVRTGRADLPPVEAVGREATRRALMGLGERPLTSGLYPCIIENVVVERLFWGLLGPLMGEPIQQRRSFLAKMLGQQIAAKILDLADEPLLPGGLGSRTYDGEGMTTMRRPVLEHGVLRTFFLDTCYASKLEQEATTGETTNLVIPPGKRDLEGLTRAMDRGILITGFSGGNSNTATGDFSIGIRGQWIEKGRVKRPVAEMNLAGNHRDFWKRLIEVGNDTFLFSSFRSPSLRLEAVQFSGL